MTSNSSPTTPPKEGAADSAALRILFIEDDPSAFPLLYKMVKEITDVEFHLDPVQGIEEAIHRLQESTPDILLMDLPELERGGMDMFYKIRRQFPDIPILVLAASENAVFGLDLIRSGAQDCLVKASINTAALSRCIHYAVARKEAERDTRESENRFQIMVDQNIDGILIVDQNGVIRFSNRAAQKMFDRQEADLNGKPFGFPMVKDEITEVEIAGRNRHSVSAEMRVAEIKWDNAPAFLATLRDISEKKQAAEEIQKIRKFESIALLAGGIAHDFNNLLAVILGNIDMAGMLIPKDHEAQEVLSDAVTGAVRAQDLVRRFVNLSRMAKPEKTRGWLKDPVQKAIARCTDNYLWTAALTVSDDLWPVDFDPDQIEQAMSQLITNAKEAMPDGGPIAVAVENFDLDSSLEKPHPVMAVKRYVRITVKDNGAGISQETLPLVFDPYYSTKARGSAKGMGLGLTTAYSIIKNHGGYLFIESEPEKGTTVKVFFPVAEKETE